MEAIQFIIVLFGAFALSRALLRVKDRQMAISAFSFWVIIWAALIFIALFPTFLTKVAKALGVSSGTNLLVIFGVMILFYLIFRLYVKIDKTEKELTRLVSELAIKETKRK